LCVVGSGLVLRNYGDSLSCKPIGPPRRVDELAGPAVHNLSSRERAEQRRERHSAMRRAHVRARRLASAPSKRRQPVARHHTCCEGRARYSHPRQRGQPARRTPLQVTPRRGALLGSSARAVVAARSAATLANQAIPGGEARNRAGTHGVHKVHAWLTHGTYHAWYARDAFTATHGTRMSHAWHTR
jgi:hypothetical protein